MVCLFRWNVPVSEIIVTNVASHMSSQPHTITAPGAVISSPQFTFVEVEADPPFPYDDIEYDGTNEASDIQDIESNDFELSHRAKRARDTLKRTSNPSASTFICTECDLSFARKIRYTDHVRYVHKKLVYRCQCGKTVQTYSAIQRHLKDSLLCTDYETVNIHGDAPDANLD